MFPIIVLVGRSNVGKSTLFNRLTHTKAALVSSNPGCTRDRNYGFFSYSGYKFCLIDTGGYLLDIREVSGVDSDSIVSHVSDQVVKAVNDSNVILFVVDGIEGLIHFDKLIFKSLFKFKKDIIIIINKIDKTWGNYDNLWSFYSLGIQYVVPISALHGRGIRKLLSTIVLLTINKRLLVNKNNSSNVVKGSDNYNIHRFKYSSHIFVCNDKPSDFLKISVIGRPNVGKSTFINCILGENRLIVCDTPGTTRDSIYIPLVYNNKNYILIDTAGMRQRSKVIDFSEQCSVNKTLYSLSISDVVLLLFDATLGIVDQDMYLLDLILRKGYPLLVLVNKWDCLLKNINKYGNKYIKDQFVVRIKYLKYVNIHFISALYNQGINSVFNFIDRVHQSSTQRFSTSKLTNIMRMAVAYHQPSVVLGKRIKLKYAHIGKTSPFIIVIHGTRLQYLSNDYKRYLSNYFMESLNLIGIKIYIKLRDSLNLNDY